jgi:hypothetical protein
MEIEWRGNAGVAQLVERDFPKVEVRGFETRLPLSLMTAFR